MSRSAAFDNYCDAKVGLSLLTQVAALELAPHGIRVNAVAPGFVHTPLTESASQISGVVDEYVENTPLGRAGTPEDIADAVLFLCRAPWLTCEVLDIKGGDHTKRYPDLMHHVMKLATQCSGRVRCGDWRNRPIGPQRGIHGCLLGDLWNDMSTLS